MTVLSRLRHAERLLTQRRSQGKEASPTQFIAQLLVQRLPGIEHVTREDCPSEDTWLEVQDLRLDASGRLDEADPLVLAHREDRTRQFADRGAFGESDIATLRDSTQRTREAVAAARERLALRPMPEIR